MALGSLTALFVKRVAEGRGDPGKYFDGGGLVLRVTPSRTSSWIFRWSRDGQRREMGLGSVDAVPLAAARELAANARRIVAAGDDPLDERKSDRAKRSGMTFDQAADRFIAAHAPGWKGGKSEAQWRAGMAAYVAPVIGSKPVAAVTTDHVLDILRPIWTTIPETANRVRNRIERILDWAKAQGLREGENPARWRGHLALMFPSPVKLRKVEHFAAVPLAALPGVYERLGEIDSVGAAAARYCILTASRPGEAVKAAWPEIDEATAVWTIPAARTKANRPHRVPLSAEALAILEAMKPLRREGSDLVFPGQTPGSHQSLSTLCDTLRRAGGGEATVHGTARSAFDDWAHERTSFPSAVVDRALAHAESDATKAAYRRSDLLEQRRTLMDQWASFLRG